MIPALEPEQDYGSDWLAGGYERLLADIMGYGKTAQLITAANRIGAERIAIACPAVARKNWERELQKWGWPHPIKRITDRSHHSLPSKDRPEAVIASYDGIAGSKRLRGALNAGIWDVLGLDEAHRLKEPTANRTKAIYGTGMDCKRSLAGKAMHRWLLTASPFPNNIGELWTHLHALWPGLILNASGRPIDRDEFLQRYCVVRRNEFGGIKVLGYRDRDGLVEILNRIMLRRDEIRGLPDLVLRDSPFLVEVDSEELRQLEAHDEFEELRQVLDSAQARHEGLDGIEDEFFHLATLRRLTGVLKAGAAAELVRETVEPGDKIVIGAIHREVIERLYAELSGLSPATVHGGIPDGRRNQEIDRFNADPSCRVFLGQIEACKECINLPAANRVLLVEQSWCPEDNHQFIARVHRRGQTRQVFAESVAIAGSIDEIVSTVLTLKTRNVHELMRERYTHE